MSVLYQGLSGAGIAGYDDCMSLQDIVIVTAFALIGGVLVLLSRRFKIGGCRPCREQKNPQDTIGPDR
jgi:hypothetical protein